MLEVSRAAEWDLDALIKIDPSLSSEKSRRDFVRIGIDKGQCVVCRANGSIGGYAVFNKEFFGQAFIWLLFTSPVSRRIGVATSIIRHIETTIDSEKLFTSTNQSNVIMQNLMKKLGFSKSGYLENLDDKDPEIFYIKKLRS